MRKRRKERLLYRSIDAAITARVRPRRRLPTLLRGLLDPRTSHYDRVGLLTNVIDRILPGVASRAADRLYRPGRLPFADVQIQICGWGSGCTVFFLDSEEGRRVLKIYRKSVGRTPKALLEFARDYKAKYDRVSSWYEAQPGLVWPASFLVLHGAILEKPAVACLQDYVEGEKRDFFRDFSDQDLFALLRNEDGLREKFCLFARRTLDILASHGRFPDLLGNRNLMLVRKGDSWKLRLIDYGHFELRRIQGRPRTARLIESHAARLRRLLDEASHPAYWKSPSHREEG